MSITIEALQFFTGRGLCDVDDVINNCIGSIVGCVLYCKGEGIFPRIQRSFPALLLVAGIIGCFKTT
ncbi:MAG: VanZ family protein, partial [Lachnospiraceae bacterium]|nr:VanZ family protein [Lachnospiraceae bacterium]